MIIYKITNTINGKMYIGQTKYTLEKRWKQHQYHIRCNSHNSYFINALRKYDVNCWNIEIIEEIYDENIINEREIYWISYYNTFDSDIGYNSTIGGEGLKRVSKITKEKMIRNMKGRIPWNKGKTYKSLPCSEEKKIKISNSQKGKAKPKHSDEERKNKSLRQTGKKKGKYKVSSIKSSKYKNKKWAFNNITGEEIRIYKDLSLPENYVYGRYKYNKRKSINSV